MDAAALTHAPPARGGEDRAPEPSGRLWRPKRVLVTRSAREWEHGRAIVHKTAAADIEVVELPSDRLSLDMPSDPRKTYVEAKSTLAIVVAPPSKRRLQPIAPSADWRVDLAEGCPEHLYFT